MDSKLDELLPAIIKAGESGLTFGALTTKFVGKSATKDQSATLRAKLASLVGDGAIAGPFKKGKSAFYFVAGHGPSIETASAVVVGLVLRSGVKLVSKPWLTKKVTGMNKPFFADGLKHAMSSQSIVELSCGKSKYYLHRDVAADFFGLDQTPPSDTIPAPTIPAPNSNATGPLTLAMLLPAYRRLKAEQGGFSAVKIFDLLRAVGGSKDDLHQLLRDETKAGRVTIHPTTTVDLPAAEVEAGIRLPGFPEPFVTVVVKNEP